MSMIRMGLLRTTKNNGDSKLKTFDILISFRRVFMNSVSACFHFVGIILRLVIDWWYRT